MFENMLNLTEEQTDEYAKRVASERAQIICDGCETKFKIRVGDLELRNEFQCPECNEMVTVDDKDAEDIIDVAAFGVLMATSNLRDEQDEDEDED